MAKKPSLAVAVHEAAGRSPTKSTAPAAVSDSTVPASRRPGRAETRVVSGHFDPAVQKQLRQLALDNDSTVQELLREALNDLFVKHQRKPFA